MRMERKTSQNACFVGLSPTRPSSAARSSAASACGAMVIVNTVVIVRSMLDGSESDVAVAFVAYGLGSMIAALMLLGLLKNRSDRPVMFLG